MSADLLNTPLLKYNWIIDFLEHFLKACGSNFLDGHTDITKLGYFYMFLVCSGISSAIYTIITADVEVSMQAVVFLCLASQGFVKFLTVNLNLPDLHTLVNYVRKVCAQNSSFKCSGFKVMDEWLHVYVLITKFFAVVIFVTMIGISSFPAIYIFLYGETTDLLPLHLPLVDQSTVFGYIQLTIFQFAMVFIGGCGLIAADLLMGLFFLYICPFTDLFKLRIVEINEVFLKDPESAKSPEFNKYLSNLVETHKDTCRYLAALSRIYTATFLLEVNADGIAMMFSVYVAMVIKWYPIYVVFFMLFSKLLSTCLLGAIVQELNHRIITAIYNCNWYMMSITHQRVFLLMLMRAQNPTVLRSGAVVIDLNLFVAVMKNIYTVAMLLLESVDE